MIAAMMTAVASARVALSRLRPSKAERSTGSPNFTSIVLRGKKLIFFE